MKQDKRRLTGSIFLAVAIHVLFLGMLVMSFDWTPRPAAPAVKVIKAVTVTEDQVRSEMQHLKQAKEKKQAQEQARLEAVKAQVAEQQRRLEAAKAQRAAEQKAAAAARQQREQEAKRQADLERKRRQAAAEAQRKRDEAAKLQAEQQRQAEAAKRLAEQKRKEEEAKRLAEEKRKQEEAARLAEQKRKEEEARRIAEEKRKAEEAKRLAEEQQRRRDEQALQQQLAAEQAQRDQRVVDQYVELIKQKVTRYWVRPSGWPVGQTCKVDIRLIPGGDVAGVAMVTTCGSTLFDQSVQTAVMRAAPLPLPPGGALFDRFREITFIFNPKES